MADCGGLPQVVQPGKLAEAFKYFVQGMGYMPTAGMTRLVRSRTHSASSVGSVGRRESCCKASVHGWCNRTTRPSGECSSWSVLTSAQTVLGGG
uniref:Protein NDRG4 n=1 Tax=Labrus bergylta TaxID=56723 RepID=A0A3Q3MAI1_9LABR